MKPLSFVSVALSALLVCSTPIQAGSVQAHMQTGPAEVLMFTGASDFPVYEEVENRHPDKLPFGVTGGQSPFLG